LLNIQRERELAAMTPEDREKAGRERFAKLRGRRKKVLTPEEKEAKRQKLNAYQRERAARERLKQSL
jgi:hypothetical protein